MSLISSLTSAATAVASGLDPAATLTTAGASRASGGGAIAKAALALVSTVAKTASTSTSKAKAAKSAPAKATTKATTTKATSKSTTSKTTTSKTTTTKAGYATPGAADFAFLKDPALSVEEKLFRFVCAIAQRNDDELLKKMDEMKGGAATAAAKSTASSSGAAKPAGQSIWGALKALIPPLGLAAQVVGDAKLKSLVTQVSGPVLAAAATALGMPALAPLALSAGPGLAGNLLDAKVASPPASSTSSGSSGAASTAASTSAASGKNEQVQLLEIQRLVDKQKEMFSMVSNILRAQHDTRMVMAGNIR